MYKHSASQYVWIILFLIAATNLDQCTSSMTRRKPVANVSTKFAWPTGVRKTELRSPLMASIKPRTFSKRYVMPGHSGAPPGASPMTNYPSPWPGMSSFPMPPMSGNVGNNGGLFNMKPMGSVQPSSWSPQSVSPYQSRDHTTPCQCPLLPLLSQQFFFGDRTEYHDFGQRDWLQFLTQPLSQSNSLPQQRPPPPLYPTAMQQQHLPSYFVPQQQRPPPPYSVSEQRPQRPLYSVPQQQQQPPLHPIPQQQQQSPAYPVSQQQQQLPPNPVLQQQQQTSLHPVSQQQQQTEPYPVSQQQQTASHPVSQQQQQKPPHPVTLTHQDPQSSVYKPIWVQSLHQQSHQNTPSYQQHSSQGRQDLDSPQAQYSLHPRPHHVQQQTISQTPIFYQNRMLDDALQTSRLLEDLQSYFFQKQQQQIQQQRQQQNSISGLHHRHLRPYGKLLQPHLPVASLQASIPSYSRVLVDSQRPYAQVDLQMPNAQENSQGLYPLEDSQEPYAQVDSQIPYSQVDSQTPLNLCSAYRCK